MLLEGFNGVGLGCNEKTEEEGLPDGIFLFCFDGFASYRFLSFLLVERNYRRMERK